MILKKKNPSNRKPISYSTEFRLDINLNNFVRKFYAAMMNAFQVGGRGRGEKGRGAKVLHTDIHTYRQTFTQTDIQTLRATNGS